MKPELVEAEKNDEEQTEAQAEKNDEVAAAQAEVEKAVEAYNAAYDALSESIEVLLDTAHKALKEAAPDEWAALDSSWDALEDAVQAAAEEASPVVFALGWDLDLVGEPMLTALIAVHANPADPFIIFIIPENIETLRASAALKQVAPVEWVACKEALAALRDKAPSEFATYTFEVAQNYPGLSLKSGYDMERYALRLQEEYDAILDAEWHARWAKTFAQQAEEHRDIGTAHAAMSAASEAFKSAREANYWQAYEAAEKAYKAVAEALLGIGKKKALEESKEWQRRKKEAADQRRTRLNAINDNLLLRYNFSREIAHKKQPEPIDDDTPLDVDIDDDIPF